MIEPVFVLSVIFLAVFVRSVFGFGDALLAMPVLSVVIGIDRATPLMAFVGFTIALMLLLSDIRNVSFRIITRLFIGSVAGIPLGIFLLTRASEPVVKLILAALIMGFCLLRLFDKGIVLRIHPRWGWFFGLLAGILGSAYNTNGPPVIIYGTLNGWKPRTFRASLQGYFLPTGVFILTGHALAGLWTDAVIRTYVYSVPLIFLGFFLGRLVHRSIEPGRFFQWVYILLILISLYLIANSIIVMHR